MLSLEGSSDNESFVKAVGNRLELIRQISTQLDWQLLPVEEKQASRLEWLASHEKRGGDTQRKRDIINIYASIQFSLPHVLVLNQNGRLAEFLAFCHSICKEIDFKGRAYDQVKIEDIGSYERALSEVENLQSYPLLKDSVDVVVRTKSDIEKTFNLPN
jgi:hypothetical protein